MTTPDTPAHTPLPWEVQPLETGEDAGVSIIGSDLGGLVCASLPWPTEIDSGDYSRVEANAAFIVRACNSHYLLIEAVERLLNMPGDIDTECNPPEMQQRVLKERLETWQFARAALSQAGGASE